MSFVERLLLVGGRFKLAAALILAALTVLAANGAMKLEIDTSYDSFVSAEDEGWPVYRRTTETFGSDNTTIITITDDDLWNVDKLFELESVVFALEDLEPVQSVDSLFTAINIRDEDGFLDTAPLMDYAPADDEEAARVRDNALYSPLVRDNLISEDGRTMAINVTVSRDRTDPDFNKALYDEIEATIAPLRDVYGEVFQIGPPRLNVEIETSMFSDLTILSPISTLVLIASIIFFLRTPFAAGIPLATSALSILFTFGFMGYTGIPLTLLTAIVPTLVIVIGSTEDTHLLTAYLRGLQDQKDPTRAKAVRYMASHVGLPVFVTGFTTAVGFLSNGLSEIPLIRDFAYASSFAMLANLIVTVLLVPLLLTVAGPTRSPLHHEKDHEDDAPTTGLIAAIQHVLEQAGEKYEKPILGITFVLLAFFAYTATDVRVSNDPLSYFKSHHPLVSDADELHDRLSGMQIFYVTVDGGQDDIFKQADPLKAIEALLAEIRATALDGTQAFDKVIGITDYLALVNREINGADPTRYHSPDTDGEVAEYYLLFQRGDIARYVSPDYRAANIVVRHNLSDSERLNAILADLEPRLQALTPAGMTLAVTGENLLINKAAESLFEGQIESLVILIVIIFVVMTALYTSIMGGIVSLVPNLIPILFNFGVMGLFGIPLNPGTATVAAIAVGIAIDDTIHLMTHYAEESRRVADPRKAMQTTVREQAVPVISTSFSLALGFGILVVSDFNIVAQFGMLAALTMLYALLSDLLVTPLVLRRIRLVGLWDIVALEVDTDVLHNSPIFEGMTRYQIRKAILLGQLRKFSKDEALMRQGESGQALYVILSGKVDVRVVGDDCTTHIRILNPGDVVGEVAFSNTVKRTADTIAQTDVLAMEMERTSMEEALRFHPKIAAALYANLLRIMSTRFAEQMRKI